uniref:Contactin 6 n=1 Tax=Panthera leo TaxID=9689 RepID=A0A8C8WL33_PANLE
IILKWKRSNVFIWCYSSLFSGTGLLSRPVFTQEPQDIIFPLDLSKSEIILNCAATGYPSPSYRWKQNGTDIDFTMSYHYRLDGGNLAISSPRTDQDIGMYQCLATNTLGTVLSRKAKLQFAYIEDFETKTRSTVSVREGQGVVLLCGPPPHFGDLSYAWTFNDNPLYVQEDNRRFVSQETGNLYIAKVEPSDVGNYTCFVTNKEAQRSVQGPPTPLVQRTDGVMGEYEPKIEVRFPETIQAAKDSSVKLECFALGNPVPDISWRRLDGNPLPGKVKYSKSQAILEIPNFQQEDEGFYECIAGNLRGRNLAKGQLIFYAPPEWEQKIQNTYLSIYDSLFWECKASGKPNPWYTWLKNGERLTPEERIQIENGTLIITMLNVSDSGVYQCAAENKYQIIYANAELRVLASAPDFSKNPLKKTSVVQVGGDITIECKPTAFPRAAISWKRGMESLRQSKRVFLSEDGSLKIYNVTRSDAGSYTCTATNQFGIAKNTGSLVVKERTVIGLSIPPSKMDVTVGEEYIIFIWSFNGDTVDLKKRCKMEHISSTTSTKLRPGSDNNSPIQIFTVQASTPFSVVVPEILSGKTHNATVKGNSIGIGEPSSIRIVKNQMPVVAPTNINGGGGSRSELVITWESIPEELQNGEEFGYIIMLRPVGSTTWTKERVPSVESSRFVYRNESITPLSPFEVKVGVYNNEGEGSLSTVSIVYSGEDEPQLAPRGTSVQSFSASEMEVSWNAIAWNRNTGRVLGYEVLYWTDDSKESMIGKIRVSGNVTTKNITGLKANTIYFASVRAYNTAGAGPSSPPVNVTTKKSPPSQPPANIAWKLTNSKLCLNWEHVKNMENESEVLGYKILYRQNRQSKTHILETNNTSAELLVPFEEDYLIEIRTVSDGGDGSSSEEIRIPKMSSLSSRGVPVLEPSVCFLSIVIIFYCFAIQPLIR